MCIAAKSAMKSIRQEAELPLEVPNGGSCLRNWAMILASPHLLAMGNDKQEAAGWAEGNEKYGDLPAGWKTKEKEKNTHMLFFF